ncbi:hypothetical protein TSUD_139050 [Trifolium subterraneum]|uniref:Pectinesterase n=1 Tax=Trifolium subterraneum TaxID=3900 RepID=A0A2Z6P7F8_TRISU|nr:hypothetical protein TSUD_139050 [Trifolium subterraneum]
MNAMVLAIVFTSAATDSYIYSSPPPYQYKSPPPSPYVYKSPPSIAESASKTVEQNEKSNNDILHKLATSSIGQKENVKKWTKIGVIGQSLDLKLRQAESNKVNISVNPNGSGDFKTITEAINNISAPNNRRVFVFIAPGLYREKIVISQDLHFITFLGDATNKPIITGNDKASTIGSDGKPLMTLKSATVAVDADYFIAINIVFENTASPRIGSNNDQAVALRISGNKCAFYNSDFYGFQDTLYDHKGLHYFNGCTIQGTTDFIFGNGRSLYEGCTLNSIAQNSGFITAQKRSSLTIDSGFSILKSKVIGSGQVYLGRPWGDYSRVIFSYTYMDNLVLPQGWVDTMDDGHHHNLLNTSVVDLDPILLEDLHGYEDCRTKMLKNLSDSISFMVRLGSLAVAVLGPWPSGANF